MSDVCGCAACLTFRKKVMTGVASKAIKPDGACACQICSTLRRYPNFAVLFGFPSADRPRPSVRAKARPAKSAPPSRKDHLREHRDDAQQVFNAIWQEDRVNIARMVMCRVSGGEMREWAEERWYGSSQHKSTFQSADQFVRFVTYMASPAGGLSIHDARGM
jgi:hypothetical protein